MLSIALPTRLHNTGYATMESMGGDLMLHNMPMLAATTAVMRPITRSGTSFAMLSREPTPMLSSWVSTGAMPIRGPTLRLHNGMQQPTMMVSHSLSRSGSPERTMVADLVIGRITAVV